MIKLFRFLKPYKQYVIVILLLLLIQSLSELYLPTLMSDIVNIGIVKNNNNYILKIGLQMLIVAACSGICTIFAGLLSAKTSMGFARNLRNEIFSKTESFSLYEFNKIETSSLITRTTNDVNQIQQVTIMILRIMVSAPIMCIGGTIMAVSKDAKLSLIFLVAAPILIILILIIAKKGIPLFKSMQTKLDKLNLVLRENLTGIRVIRAFNRVNDEKIRFSKANDDLTETAIKVNKLLAILMPAMILIMNFTCVAIVWFGGIRINNGDMQIGDMMAFIQYAMQIMFSLVMVSMMFVLIPRAEASAERINEVLETNSQITDVEKIEDFKNEKYLEFKNVTFSYPGAEQPVLNNISFKTKPGEITAIIGSTGSGKSTIINLIPRFYDIDKGDILINGINIKNVSQKTLRSKIGFVPQKAVLFTGTISENIKYGNENASKEDIKYAADIAQASEFISTMEDKFDSYISQGGKNISGGQKQRISIARALIKKPEIYIFDDSFSALDFKTDAKLREKLKEETKDAITIIVAQRISTVMDADKIIVLDEGNIVGIGTHKELLNSCEIYKEIVLSQLSEEELL